MYIIITVCIIPPNRARAGWGWGVRRGVTAKLEANKNRYFAYKVFFTTVFASIQSS